MTPRLLSFQIKRNLSLNQNILWLSGSPGAGKSSLAVKLRDRGRLGSIFFFRRENITLSDPTVLWRTDLVEFDPAIRHSLVEVLD
jgi:predicted ATPase